MADALVSLLVNAFIPVFSLVTLWSAYRSLVKL